MRVVKRDDGSIDIHGPITHGNQLVRGIPADCEILAIRDQKFFSGKLAVRLREFEKLKEVWLWCDVGRSAIQHFLSMPNIEKLETENIRSPGRRMCRFSEARKLKVFRCCFSDDIHRSELHAITQSTSIEELGIRGATIDKTTIENIVKMPALENLNLGDTNLDDNLALRLSKSSSIKSLFIACTEVASVGFTSICEMRQLTYLDAWSTRISDSDLHMLANLENLDFLSIGEMDEVDTFRAEIVLKSISNVPSVSRLWLDGIKFTDTQKKQLEKKFDEVIITYAEPIDE